MIGSTDTQKQKPTVTILNWMLRDMGEYYCLHGQAVNHPRFDPGTTVTTSRLRSIDFENGTAETVNTIYLLK